MTRLPFGLRSFPARAAAAALVLCALSSLPSTAAAGWDDFEFGQKLVERGYFDYARQVFQAMLDDKSRPQADRDRAKFGMATLGRAELSSAGASAKTSYADVKAKYDAALSSIREFVQKNASDPMADDARFEMGKLGLWFVTWANGLVSGDAAELKNRGVKAADALGDAQKAIDTAINVFGELKEGARKEGDKNLAKYQWTTAHFYRGLVFPKCSPDAIAAFGDAKKLLDDYITEFDGFLFAVYAQDNLGRTYQELGDCESDADRKDRYYRDAMDQFSACANTEDASPEHRQLIALGFLHAGQLANHAGDASDTKARQHLVAAKKLFAQLKTRAPRAMSLQDGCLAMVEWALVEAKLENVDQAISIAKEASDAAAKASFGAARARADDALGQIMQSPTKSGGGATASGDPGVFQKVGDDQFRKGKYAEAVGAYQRAISASNLSTSPQAYLEVVLPSWRGIGDCYARMTPPLWLEAATAYDAICDEVRGGRLVLVSDQDARTRLAWNAAEAERLALTELYKATGDAGIRDRMQKFGEWENRVFKDKIGGTTDRIYAEARRKFDEGVKEKAAADGKGEGWKRGFQEAKQGFTDTSKNIKSEYQDNAWTYLVRTAYELGEFDEAVRQVDAAFAYWKTPEADLHVKDQPDLAARRKQQGAAIVFWKAAALRERGKLDEALAIAQGYSKAYGGVAGDYKGRALGLGVEILLAQQKMKEAEAALEDLVREQPDYYQLPKILLKLAAGYDADVQAIGEKVSKINEQIAGTPEDRSKGLNAQLRASDRLIVDLRNTLSGWAQTLDHDEKIVKMSDNKTEVQLAQAEIDKLTPLFAKGQEDLKAAKEKSASIRAEIAKLSAERTALKQQSVPPLRKTADLYKRLDDAFKELDAKRAAGENARRKVDSVSALAYRFYKLATLDPTATGAWDTARSLYEDVLAFPAVKSAPDTDPEKRKTYRFLGEIYDKIADEAIAKGRIDDAREAAQKASRYLEGAMAKNPVNTSLLVGHLAGEVAVIEWRDAETDRTWRIPVRRVADVAALREQLKGLTGDRLPRYARDDVQKDFERAVANLRRHVEKQDDADLKGLVAGVQAASFNGAFFSEHAVTSNEFFLTLAHSYVRSGLADATGKAMNTARLVLGALKGEDEETPPWWEAKTIQLEALVSAAERLIQSEGPESANAKARARDADKLLVATKQTTPVLGGADPEAKAATLKEWKALQTRIASVMGRLGLEASAVDLEAMPPESAPEPEKPPEPAAPPPAPASPPAMEGATPPGGMDGAPSGDGAK
jgi:hypothetical protein